VRTLRLSALLATLVLLAASVPCAAQQGQLAPPATVIAGTLLGADGAPMKLAHVHLLTAGSALVARALVEPDGRFALATARAGIFRLEFTGVGHYVASIPLYAPTPVSVVIQVRLKHYAYADTLDKVTAIGDWNHFRFQDPKPLVRQPDGRYSVTVDAAADTLSYELLGVEGAQGRSINGTMSDRYAYDEGGDYRSVIAAHDGHATIVFDPSKLDRRPPGEVSMTFADPKSPEARLYALWGNWQSERRHWQDSAQAASKRHERANYDWSRFLAGRIAMLLNTREPMVRQLVLEQILDATAMGGKIDTRLARRIIRELQPTSAWWALYEFGSPSRMMVAYSTARGDSAQARDTSALRQTLGYVDRAVAENPDSTVKAEALSQGVMLAQELRDGQLATNYYNRLVTEYPAWPDLGAFKAMYAPNRVWQVGHDVPAFRFASLDDTTVTYAPESFAGKIYLLDFWATWCGPCLGQMEYLHAAHDSLAARGLVMLSISLDKSADDVRKFRGGQWKMPWLHAFPSGQFQNEDIKRLEIVFIPRAALVGRDGKVLAVDDDLRGDALLPALRHALEATPSP
jgi:thiol-disulfide isomerase/thioredoxin